MLSPFIFSPFVLMACCLAVLCLWDISVQVAAMCSPPLWQLFDLCPFPCSCLFLSGRSDLAQKRMLGGLPEHCLCRGSQVLTTAGEINALFLFLRLAHPLSVYQEANQAQPVLRCLLTFSSCAFLICLCSLFPSPPPF